MKLYFQGDLCIEPVASAAAGNVANENNNGNSHVTRNIEPLPTASDGAVVLAEGETTGHRHAFYGGGVLLYRDDALARDLPRELYIAHLRVDAEAAELRHEEHATITLPRGLYRVRRQREYDGSDVIDEPRARFSSRLVVD